LEVTKTVRVPVHHLLTKRKLSIMNRLTARMSYGVGLFSQLIEQRNMRVEHYGEFSRSDIAEIGKITKLQIAYVQECRDQALWLWRSYQTRHAEWEKRYKYAKGKWREKLARREPHKPFYRGMQSKIPVRIDKRMGSVEASEQMKLSSYVIRLSTLKKGCRVTIPLNPVEYHKNLLRQGRIVDFQLIKRDGRFYAHICVKYTTPDRPVHGVRAIDLGVRRAVATVLLTPNGPLRRRDFAMLSDGEERHRLNMLNRRFAKLQTARMWQLLKHLRHKRRHVADYTDRLIAKKVADMAERESAMVVVGYPKEVKYDNYRGNGKPGLRRTMHRHFRYGRRIRYILDECAERGIEAETVFEAWTSKRCHRCSSTNTRRISQALFWCLDCGLHYDADWNAAINIGQLVFAERLGRWATEGLAYAGDELTYKPASPEVRNMLMS